MFSSCSFSLSFCTIRLSCQLVPETGILFLVLPARCINSKHVGGINLMTSLLSGLGLRQVLPVRQTPKLIFFILGNSTEKKKKISLSDKVENDSAGVGAVRDGKISFVAQEVFKDHTEEEGFSWKDTVRNQLASTLKPGTLKHFTQDFSGVPPNEFAIELSTDLVDLL